MNKEPDSEIESILRQQGWKPETETAKEEEGPAPLPMENEEPEEQPDTKIRRMPEGMRESTRRPRDPWIRIHDQVGKVTISAEELALYTKALLFDERFELGIPVYLGEQPVVVTLRSLYVSEREVMALALKKLIDEYPVPSMQSTAIVADAFLKMAIVCQAVAIDDKPLDVFDARPEPGQFAEESPTVGAL